MRNLITVLMLAGLPLFGMATVANAAPDCSKAADRIADRLESDRPIFEDWTWHGAPRLVGRCNDALLEQWHADGGRGNDRDPMIKWLRNND